MHLHVERLWSMIFCVRCLQDMPARMIEAAECRLEIWMNECQSEPSPFINSSFKALMTEDETQWRAQIGLSQSWRTPNPSKMAHCGFNLAECSSKLHCGTQAELNISFSEKAEVWLDTMCRWSFHTCGSGLCWSGILPLSHLSHLVIISMLMTFRIKHIEISIYWTWIFTF